MKPESLTELVARSNALTCLDCGKCSALCPISRWGTDGYSSPRLLIEITLAGQEEELKEDTLLWSCLSCKRCSELCPSAVDFTAVLRELREAMRGNGCNAACTHNEIFQTLGRMMTKPDKQQKRLDWLSDDLRVAENSDTVFFVGCAPYYEVVFSKLGVNAMEISRSSIKVLNRLGITPQVIADERCCGHDQLWQGDLGTFRSLATMNIEKIHETGATRVVTSCPECTHTLKIDYPKFIGSTNFEVINIIELIAESDLLVGDIQLDGSDIHRKSASVTYQDSCRLGRHLDIFDAPREIIARLGLSISEMDRSRRASLCCGTSCWTACGQVNKKIQVERLKEAKATGADLLVTSCIKCQIHFKCAQNDPILSSEIGLEIRDLVTLIADCI